MLCLPAIGQQHPDWRDRGGRGGWEQDRDHGNSQAYRNGYEHGLRDRERRQGSHPRGQRWKNGNDRRAYEAGYNAGFSGAAAQSGPQYGRGGMGGYGNAQGGQAARVGYQDGFSHGQGDLASGRGYSPTGSQNYKDGDHGWNSSLGDKNQYRPVYRQAYMEGYQRGYGRR
jgi:hypothetical protein